MSAPVAAAAIARHHRATGCALVFALGIEVAHGPGPRASDGESAFAEWRARAGQDIDRLFGDDAGVVRALLIADDAGGAGDVLEVKRDNGASEYVPFTDDAVPAVDIAGGRVVIVLPSESGDA